MKGLRSRLMGSALTAALCGTLVACSGLGLWRDGAKQPQSRPLDASTATPPEDFDITEPSPDAGLFFTWQQDRAWSGEAARVAETQRGVSYYSALSLRYGGFVDPAWTRLVPADADLTPADGLAGLVRGPTTVRLIRLDVAGSTATTVTCVDESQTKIRSRPAQRWRDPGTRYSASAQRFERAGRSPTGWVLAGPATTAVSAAQCPRLMTSNAAIEEPGPPAGLDGR